MNRVLGLSPDRFEPKFRMNDEELAAPARSAAWRTSWIRTQPRESRHGRAGRRIVLLPYRHQASASPYQASGPTYAATRAGPADAVNRIPPMQARRLFGTRA
jgi:hypothetical protein